MANKKPAEPGKGGRYSVIHIQGPAEERDWLTLLHERTHIPKVTIVRLALKDWAKKHGHPDMPEV